MFYCKSIVEREAAEATQVYHLPRYGKQGYRIWIEFVQVYCPVLNAHEQDVFQ